MVFQELTPWRKNRGMVHPGQEKLTPGTLQCRINRIFDDFFGDFGPTGLGKTVAFVPRMDVLETENEIKVTAELAGIEEKDVEITLQDDLLTIKGEKKDQRQEKNERYFVSERSYGSFSRSILLPETIQQDKINAVFQKGILTLTLPKLPAPEARSKKIQIKTA